ncbi:MULTISPECIES: metal ABC transporter permease [Pasteurellaceae]|uniref:Metal ABC transporter permease n=1 Tax=Pasteurella atlantica TaxID=2827233 RepID=A0AAW8CGU1_9PAST|nr:metal ABC transporter permease [Pasteurella atlantica]MBR0574448.1 metal ABC transporter permease [Pasteurella atlantica]MDP8039325.1 metal ABC transporter permease [Pasteurella atlantica]MDP8041417.1 metal ABC transporter permease [Pasteurella atlantica]MDP8043658.1 metal ABC transporter permease [Pasteurella atlantica]MDP8045638.1 metal ABC transporter permease [Pasteurella atlantica]
MNSIISWFSDPFEYYFMQKALFTAIGVSVVCAILSCYLVLKGWSLMGDAISHAVLPGIVLAAFLGLPIFLGAFLSGIACTTAIGYIKDHSRIKEDTAMGIVFAGMFGLGLVMFSKIKTSQHLTHILFGHLLGISYEEMIETLIISGVVFIIMYIKRKDFLLYCFDPNYVRVVGLSPKILHYGLLSLLAFSIISAMHVVGVILVVAMLISPGIIGYTISKRFDVMMVIAIFVSVITSIFGTIISFHIDGATGPCIVLLQAVVFIIVLVVTKIKASTVEKQVTQ